MSCTSHVSIETLICSNDWTQNLLRFPGMEATLGLCRKLWYQASSITLDTLSKKGSRPIRIDLENQKKKEGRLDLDLADSKAAL